MSDRSQKQRPLRDTPAKTNKKKKKKEKKKEKKERKRKEKKKKERRRRRKGCDWKGSWYLEAVAEEKNVTLGFARGEDDSWAINQLDVLVKDDFLIIKRRKKKSCEFEEPLNQWGRA